MACNILGLRVSYCSVCNGCFVCPWSLYHQSLTYCSIKCCGVFWGRTESMKLSGSPKMPSPFSSSPWPLFHNLVLQYFQFPFFLCLICWNLISSPAASLPLPQTAVVHCVTLQQLWSTKVVFLSGQWSNIMKHPVHQTVDFIFWVREG